MNSFYPERLLKTLGLRRVRYVLVGAVAARLQGFPRMTADTDISPARGEENLKRLAAALRDIRRRASKIFCAPMRRQIGRKTAPMPWCYGKCCAPIDREAERASARRPFPCLWL
jgi:hypothetical protein